MEAAYRHTHIQVENLSRYRQTLQSVRASTSRLMNKQDYGP